MNLRAPFITLCLLFTAVAFSQEGRGDTTKKVMPGDTSVASYLVNIKKSFVSDPLAERVDSLWLKRVGELDAFYDLEADIRNIDTDIPVDYELSTEVLKQRLAELDAKSPFDISYNIGLENIIKSFLKHRKTYFERLITLSDYYFPLFEETLDKNDLPLEIKYLAVVESALNPRAVSRVGATGLWQFMFHTGKQYKLNVDSYIDDRRDPLKSSYAAAKYLKDLYGMFGDWDLALAAYNSGPGNVSKAIRRSGGARNYWVIKRFLPKETRGYVPAFLASMYIFEYYDKHGLVPQKALVKYASTDTVHVKHELTFKQISDLMDIPMAQIQVLNPSYKLNVIPGYQKGEPNCLRLPLNKVSTFTSNEDKIYAYAEYAKQKSPKFAQKYIVENTTKYHKVRAGETVSTIARKYRVSAADIKTWNKLRGNTVKRGARLKIMVESISVANAGGGKGKFNSDINQVFGSKENKVVAKKDIAESTQDSCVTHIVQKGETIQSIAETYMVSDKEIIETNKLKELQLKEGTALIIVKAKEGEDDKEIELTDVEYQVAEGDNLSKISKKFGTPVADLKTWNKLEAEPAVGISIIVAKNEVSILHNTPKETFSNNDNQAVNSGKYYEVQKRDTLWSISQKYPGVTVSDLKKWNNLKSGRLTPGMRLVVNHVRN